MLNIMNIRECSRKIFVCSMCEKRSGQFWDLQLMLRLLNEEGWVVEKGVVYCYACYPNLKEEV